MPDEQLYDGLTLERCVIGERKLYFAKSDKFPFSSDEIERKKYLLRRSSIINSLGFGIVWEPHVTVADVRKDLRGFENLGFYNVEADQHSPLTTLCQADAKIIGGEADILMNSKSKEDYFSEWFLQDRFKQKHRFKL